MKNTDKNEKIIFGLFEFLVCHFAFWFFIFKLGLRRIRWFNLQD